MTDRSAPSTKAMLPAYEAALVIASDLRLDVVLQRIVDLARSIVPAKYAALGVCNDQGRIVEFITSGIDEETVARIGPIPQGHGLLGALIREGKPMLVPDISADPRSVGFPSHHPPMRTLLGVPIQLGDRTLGDLYLTEREGGDPFTEEDLEVLQVLAAHAATAIERAQLYRRLEEGRQHAEEQRDNLRVLLDNLPSGIFIHAAPDARIAMANEAASSMVFGGSSRVKRLPLYADNYRLLDADGRPLPAGRHPAARALRGETVRNQQFTLQRTSGETLPVLAQAAPLFDAGGQPTQAVVVFQDVTRLREAEQLKDDFLSLVSHEFRTPLTAINGGAQLLAQQGDALDRETSRELLLDIVNESSKLDRMLANMLSVAAFMAGRMQPDTDPVLIEPLARRISAEIAGRSPGYTFAVDLPADLPTAEGDPELISQILRNLYENVVKYSPGGGEVRTSASHAHGWITVDISDGGVGIAPEALPHLFQRFRRPGADPTVRGMGLGLYLSRLLVAAQGGKIVARSDGPGKGATFSIMLPVAPEATSQ